MENNFFSPCNGNCEIDLNTQLCKGCYRYMEEIINWPLYPEEKKQEIARRVQERRAAIEEEQPVKHYKK